jgi:hypothetical protein
VARLLKFFLSFQLRMNDIEFWAYHFDGETTTIRRTFPYEKVIHCHETQKAYSLDADGNNLGPVAYNRISRYLSHQLGKCPA